MILSLIAVLVLVGLYLLLRRRRAVDRSAAEAMEWFCAVVGHADQEAACRRCPIRTVCSVRKIVLGVLHRGDRAGKGAT